MKNSVCAICFQKAEHRHHLFSQTKWARKLYGKLLDHESNLLPLCSVCHLNKPIPKQSEIEFCKKIGIKPRSKVCVDFTNE